MLTDFKRIREAVHGRFLDALIFELSNSGKRQKFGRYLNRFGPYRNIAFDD